MTRKLSILGAIGAVMLAIHAGASGDDLPAPAPARDYAIAGTQVRDHRATERPQLDLPPNLHPPGSHLIAPAVVHDIAGQIKQVMRGCLASVPRDARGGRLEGEIEVRVQGGTLAVANAPVQLRGMTGATADGVRRCVEDGARRLTAPAPGEPDIAAYAIHLSFAIR